MVQGIKMLFALFIISTISVDANAQLLKRLKDKAKDRVNEKIENKIDQKLEEAANKMVDKTWESVFGEQSDTDAKGASPRSLPFTLNSNVNTEEEYSFNRFSEMEIITIDENDSKSAPTLMKMFFDKDGEYSGTSFINEESRDNEEEVTIVYDYKNNAMVMLMDSKDGKASFAYDWAQTAVVPGYEETDFQEFSEYEELGSKTILGYECKGYKTEDEYSSTEFWVTDETDSGYQQMMSANGSTRYFQGRTLMLNSSATVMEMTSVNKQNNEKMVMKMTKVDESTRVSFIMNDYPTIGSPGN